METTTACVQQQNKSDSSYVADELIKMSETSNDMEAAIFNLLGGKKAVRRADEAVKIIPVVFPNSESSAKVRLIRLVTYIKL